MLIGTRPETPRFYNIGDKDRDNKRFLIQSTQKHGLFFWVEAPDEEYWNKLISGEISEIWAQIKKWRTQFLLENYPTIDPY
jgi:hypothetical protein